MNTILYCTAVNSCTEITYLIFCLINMTFRLCVLMNPPLDHMPWTAVPIFGLALYLVYHFYIYPAFVSPLSRIPNAHWSAPISPLWILSKRFTHHENRTLQAAHRRLGPFLRIAPNEVSVDDLDAVKQIYLGGFEKPEWYSVFDNYG